MIKLRQLEIFDAIYMLEWLNDPKVTSFLDVPKERKSIEAVHDFIIAAQKDIKNKHFAICDDDNVYLGTISLKNLDLKNKHAEYAIVLCSSQNGKGIASKATQLLIDNAKKELGLHKIYLNVLVFNERAIRLYEKSGFQRKGIFEQHILIGNKYQDLYYYEMLLEEIPNEI
jgi:UDP-4-amino-4,6-dideoxy-N-acetyl-beta-L-altrosamine N-acetyltransferase